MPPFWAQKRVQISGGIDERPCSVWDDRIFLLFLAGLGSHLFMGSCLRAKVKQNTMRTVSFRPPSLHMTVLDTGDYIQQSSSFAMHCV